MMQEEKKLTIALDKLPDGGMLIGHAGDEQILLVRRGSEVFALGAQFRGLSPRASWLATQQHLFWVSAFGG